MTDEELYNDIRKGFDGPQRCDCGSKEPRYALNDTMGIFCTYVCSFCEGAKREKYRPETFGSFEDYQQNALECGEDIEPDEW